MTKKKSTSFGSWKSPITADLIVAETVKLGQIMLDGEDVFWSEMRPSEGGRSVIVKKASRGFKDFIPHGYSARSRAHEYGGGSFVVHDGYLYFSNDRDQRIYRQSESGNPAPLTPGGAFRFADGIVDPQQNRLISVLEDHSTGRKEPLNSLAAIDIKSGNFSTLVSGNDFYSSPCLSPDGQKLCWLCWNHPSMPWDGTELYCADVKTDGSLINITKIAGGSTESIFQPQWSPEGKLHFVSDKSGWWNLYSHHGGQTTHLLDIKAEFGLPQWIFGMSTYAFATERLIVCTYFCKGKWCLGLLNTQSAELENIELPFTHIEGVRANKAQAFFIAGSPVLANAVVSLDLASHEFEIIRRSADLALDSTYLSRPEAIEFSTPGGQEAYAYYYRPQNRDYEPPQDQKPPLIVKSHGGPTAAATTSLDLRIQFWTSRGFAVLEVNYGGSTGYGREYRERLNHNWGIVDVNDCENAAKYLVKQRLVDSARIAIAGGSAGGYTTLCALTFKNFFKAGASYYGICDLEAMAKDTHKFESRYLDRLIGPYPQMQQTYVERSPIHHTELLSCPIILLQGKEDKVVPPSQAEIMHQALKSKGLPVACIVFEGEQHGFRNAENIKRALEAELYFYSKIFGFEPADVLEPVKIENL